jgi:hypothetical protein
MSTSPSSDQVHAGTAGTARLACPCPCCALQLGCDPCTSQLHGFPTLCTPSCAVLCPPAKLWCDVESADEAAELSSLYGVTLVPSFTATKLLWLKRREPESWARLAHVLLPHDYINWWLTGRLCMEVRQRWQTGALGKLSLRALQRKVTQQHGAWLKQRLKLWLFAVHADTHTLTLTDTHTHTHRPSFTFSHRRLTPAAQGCWTPRHVAGTRVVCSSWMPSWPAACPS